MADARLRRAAQRALAALLRAFLALVALTALLVVPLRWIDPATSSFLLQHRAASLIDRSETSGLRHEWVDWEAIAPAVPLAVVAAEDQRFPQHSGFDLVEIGNAWEDFRSGGRLRGASTISQQVAKNLFLWRGRDWVRKGLEAWFTVAIELAWPKRRILEIYLNIAQFGPDTFGVGAASWKYFDRPAAALGAREASLLAAVLPNPERYRPDAPSAHTRQRAAWITGQMEQLGAAYLEGL
jgi:monofunctional biosynthetic peptidoglycan transglycosylase